MTEKLHMPACCTDKLIHLKMYKIEVLQTLYKKGHRLYEFNITGSCKKGKKLLETYDMNTVGVFFRWTFNIGYAKCTQSWVFTISKSDRFVRSNRNKVQFLRIITI